MLPSVSHLEAAMTSKQVNRKIEGVPESQLAAYPQYHEEENNDKN